MPRLARFHRPGQRGHAVIRVARERERGERENLLHPHAAIADLAFVQREQFLVRRVVQIDVEIVGRVEHQRAERDRVRQVFQTLGLDVGHDQLHVQLRGHPQVTCIEGLNARDLQALDPRLGAGLGFDLVVGDVSFISLTLVLPALRAQLKPGGQMLMLVKPQFELQPGQLGKGGIVKDEALYEQVQQRIVQACHSLGLTLLHWLNSAIEGGDGNREFFIYAVQAHPTRDRS